MGCPPPGRDPLTHHSSAGPRSPARSAAGAAGAAARGRRRLLGLDAPPGAAWPPQPQLQLAAANAQSGAQRRATRRRRRATVAGPSRRLRLRAQGRAGGEAGPEPARPHDSSALASRVRRRQSCSSRLLLAQTAATEATASLLGARSWRSFPPGLSYLMGVLGS